MKFTVHTKTNLTDYLKNDFAVTRLHDDFVWLHDDIRGKLVNGSIQKKNIDYVCIDFDVPNLMIT